MSLSRKVKNDISELLKITIREKLEKYIPETSYMPFHYRLLGRDRYAIFSFVHSMNTTFGISIWEQVAVILAKNKGNHTKRQYVLKGEIDNLTEKLINEIHSNLRKGLNIPNNKIEVELIRKKIKNGNPKKDPDSIVDFYVKFGEEENYFDITSAKPNMKEFASLKLKLLRWIALRLSLNNKIKIKTRLAIPYNPYYPNLYERWTLKGLYDLDNGEILVGEEFWNFVGSDNIYDDLLDIFNEVGEELRNEIDKKFSEF